MIKSFLPGVAVNFLLSWLVLNTCVLCDFSHRTKQGKGTVFYFAIFLHLSNFFLFPFPYVVFIEAKIWDFDAIDLAKSSATILTWPNSECEISLEAELKIDHF